jgi:uncharacterized membrane protein YfhO
MSSVVLTSEGGEARVLVDFQRYSAGWRAYLRNGRELEVFPAFHIFRGVLLPAGEREIEFRYEPRSFSWGLFLSGVGFLTALMGAFLIKRLEP